MNLSWFAKSKIILLSTVLLTSVFSVKSALALPQVSLTEVESFLSVLPPAIRKPVKPDEQITKGHLCSPKDPDLEGYRYSEHIAVCKRVVSTSVKNRIYLKYNVALVNKKYYTIDHFIPLAIGGSNDEDNLWPEPRAVKRTRPNLEMDIYEAMKRGQMSQREAIRIIVEAKMNPKLP